LREIPNSIPSLGKIGGLRGRGGRESGEKNVSVNKWKHSLLRGTLFIGRGKGWKMRWKEHEPD